MQKLIYPLSLIILATALYLFINPPETGHANFIAGILISIGFLLNIIGYCVVKSRAVKIS